MSGLNGRVVSAVAIVAIIVFSIPLADVALRAAGVVQSNAMGRVDESRGLSVGELLNKRDAGELLAGLAEITEDTAAAPAWFEAEIGLLPGARDVRVDGTVVGYVVDAGEAETYEALRKLMEAGGWTSVPLGGVTGATFVKNAGECTWALVTCTQAGFATSVVTRTMR